MHHENPAADMLESILQNGERGAGAAATHGAAGVCGLSSQEHLRSGACFDCSSVSLSCVLI